MTVRVAVATREGTHGPLADATAVFRSAGGAVAAAVVDGMGHGEVVRLAPVLAETAVRLGAARGPLAGLLTAGLLVRDPGPPDAVAVLAVRRPDGGVGICWAGDCAAYQGTGTGLRKVTTDHTLAAYIQAACEAPQEVAASFGAFVRVTLGKATPATAHELVLPEADLLLLTSDGVHDQVPHGVMERLVRERQGDPQALVEALVAAAKPDGQGYRDDATALAMLP